MSSAKSPQSYLYTPHSTPRGQEVAPVVYATVSSTAGHLFLFLQQSKKRFLNTTDGGGVPCKQQARILRRNFGNFVYRRTGSTTHQVIRQEVSRGVEQDNGVEVHVDPLV